MSTIKIEIDGELLDRSKCSWYTIAPCGCTSGSALATYYSLDEEAAWVEIFDTQTEAKRRQKMGYRLEMGRLADVTARLASGQCPHEPLWGVKR